MKKFYTLIIVVLMTTSVCLAQSFDASYSVASFDNTDSDNGVAVVEASFDFGGRKYLFDLSFSRFVFDQEGLSDTQLGNVGIGTQFDVSSLSVPMLIYIPVVSATNSAAQTGLASLQAQAPERFSPDAWSLVARPNVDFEFENFAVDVSAGLSAFYFTEDYGTRGGFELAVPLYAATKRQLIGSFYGIASVDARWWFDAEPSVFAEGALAAQYNFSAVAIGLMLRIPLEENMDGILTRTARIYVGLN